MDDIEIVDADDDYYAYLNLPRDVSFNFHFIFFVLFCFAIYDFDYISYFSRHHKNKSMPPIDNSPRSFILINMLIQPKRKMPR